MLVNISGHARIEPSWQQFWRYY